MEPAVTGNLAGRLWLAPKLCAPPRRASWSRMVNLKAVTADMGSKLIVSPNRGLIAW